MQLAMGTGWNLGYSRGARSTRRPCGGAGTVPGPVLLCTALTPSQVEALTQFSLLRALMWHTQAFLQEPRCCERCGPVCMCRALHVEA